LRPSVKARRELAATIRFDPRNTAASGKLRAQHRISRPGAVAAFLSAEGAAGYLHPALGEALAAADVIIPAIVLLVLLAAILRGSTETCDRAFRLLRWIANRPEPPAPDRNTVRSSSAQQPSINRRSGSAACPTARGHLPGESADITSDVQIG
jgi:hypothetical protein